jgi:prepilin-type N-terminal cleavage/methylation domain-containing protein
MAHSLHSQDGFTLAELLVVVGLMGIISALGFTSANVYRGEGAYAVAQSLVRDGITSIEVALSTPDQTLPTIATFSQSIPGAINDSTAAAVLPGLIVPRKVKFQFSFDPSCTHSSCVVASIQANHCQGLKYVRWIRYGDGLDVRLDNVAGIGCN